MGKEEVQKKLKNMNKIGQEIHEAISFLDGEIVCKLQVGHPGEEGEIKGCFPTHLLDFIIELHYYYNAQIPCRETSIVITKLEEARLWMEKRKIDREKRG